MKKFLLILCAVFLFTGCSEKNTESSISEPYVYEQQTYREVLENIYYNYEFPNWNYKNCTDVSIDFAVYDIDNDSREELLVTFDDYGLNIYDHNADGNLVNQFSGYIMSDFYENGAVKVYSAHNQGNSFEIHPFQMYRYNAETDSYELYGSVRGIDKDVVDMVNKEKEEVGRTDFLEYPSEYDTSSSGTIYYIRCGDDTTDIPMSEAEYNEYYSQFTENTDIIDIPFMKLTEENIKKVSGDNFNEEKNFSYNITDSGGVEIYLNGGFYQLLDVAIDNTFLDYESGDLVQFNDYDFDGFNDIAVEKALATNAVFSYFRYNPDTEYFESWTELDNLYFYIKINDNKTLSVHSKSSAVNADDTVYKWSGDVLVPVSAEKRYWNSEGIFMDCLEYDGNGNETLIKREKQVYDDNGRLISVTDVTP